MILFLGIVIVFLAVMIKSLWYYYSVHEAIRDDAKKEAYMLKEYMMSMREVYQKQFIDSGLEINDKTIDFLPAHASTLISDRFSQKNMIGFYIRNVSDMPRNPKNQADLYEIEAMEYFRAHPQENEYFKEYPQVGNGFVQYASPIYIQEQCLMCHGTKEETIGSISERYDDAYNYHIGDLRGVVSVKIPYEDIKSSLYKFIKYELMGALFLLLVLIGLMLIVFKNLFFELKKSEKEAKAIAHTDALTRLYNRHYLENLELSKSEACVAFLDIDYFKKINDTYGHEAGDVVLQEFARLITSQVRSDDIVVRYGGEEFLIIMEGVSYEAAMRKLEAIRGSVEELCVIYKDETICVTVSIGFVNSSIGESLESLIARADQNLYEAKERGRNRVVS